MKYFKYLIFTTLAFCFVFFVYAGFFWIQKTHKINAPTKKIGGAEIALNTTSQKETEIIKIRDIEFEAEVLDEEDERVRGLSGRESLEKDRVMLFVFEKEEYAGIWMKDMNFDIDIAWVDKNGKIIHIERNVSPKTFPKVFFAPVKSLYVLETNAGFFDHHNFRVGDLVEISF